MVCTGPQAELDESSRVWNLFGLPAMIALVAPHGLFALVIPVASGLAAQIVFADQSFLDGSRSLRIDLFLPAHACDFLLFRRVFRVRSCVA